jgi:hypothetical protein
MLRLTLVANVVVAFVAAQLYAHAGHERKAPPENAIILMDGKDLSKWQDRKSGGEANWKLVEDGAAEVNGGDIVTRDKFKDFMIHVEFRTPIEDDAKQGQHRGNSGVYLQGRYEIQVLESYGLEPMKNGCGSIYNVKAPDKNMAKPPGEWQTYQILFRAARFDDQGNKTENARVTVFHNGEKIHDDVEIPGSTGSGDTETADNTGPIRLQDHGHKVQYRNIWLVPLKSE